jgi:neutral ceramidase
VRATPDARIPLWAGLLCIGLLCGANARAADAQLIRAGTSIVDITPTTFPVLVNGMFTSRSATGAHDPLHVRCIVLEQGMTKIAIAVVDSCMVPRDILDRAKQAAEVSTGIPADHMLISSSTSNSCRGGSRWPSSRRPRTSFP